MLVGNVDGVVIKVHSIGGGDVTASINSQSPQTFKLKHVQGLGYYFNIGLCSIMIDELEEDNISL